MLAVGHCRQSASERRALLVSFLELPFSLHRVKAALICINSPHAILLAARSETGRRRDGRRSQPSLPCRGHWLSVLRGTAVMAPPDSFIAPPIQTESSLLEEMPVTLQPNCAKLGPATPLQWWVWSTMNLRISAYDCDRARRGADLIRHTGRLRWFSVLCQARDDCPARANDPQP